MRKLIALLASTAVVLALGACSQMALVSMDGSYAVTLIVAQTNTPGVTVGDVEGFPATVTTTGNQVEMTSPLGFVATGTRAGNSVLLEGTDGGTEVWTFDLTWTSETVFEGEGSVEDGAEYVDFEAHGFSSPLLAGE